jgi:hypothetical protein
MESGGLEEKRVQREGADCGGFEFLRSHEFLFINPKIFLSRFSRVNLYLRLEQIARQLSARQIGGLFMS